jgi:hypothetical protein
MGGGSAIGLLLPSFSFSWFDDVIIFTIVMAYMLVVSVLVLWFGVM